MFCAPSGPADSHHTCKSYLPARLTAVWIQPRTSQTEFAFKPLPTTASVSRPTPDTTAGLLERNELTRQVASLQASQHGSRSHSRGRHRSQSSDRRNTPNYPPTPHDTCWYHWKFGDEARKCTPPCCRQQRDSRQERDSRQQENFTSGR